jgi:hypothetical protein
VPHALRCGVTPAKIGRRLLLKHAASVQYNRFKLVSVIMSQESGSGAAASPQLPGLQLCDISDLILDSATEPKEGGFGNTIKCTLRHANTKLSIASALDEFKCIPHALFAIACLLLLLIYFRARRCAARVPQRD